VKNNRNKKIFCFDLDNVICATNKNYYLKSKPIKHSINIINKLYEKGFVIKIFTSRYMGRSNENVKTAISKGYKFTEIQLKKWGIRYHKLIFGKPSFDYVIDDKSIHFKKNWQNLLEKKFISKS
jgi:hypothetical protein